MPLLMFLLLLVLVVSPLAKINPIVLVMVVALQSVFLAGWLNMFHMCLENSQDENISDEQKAFNSLNLYKEFFPGVGKYFQKIFWGLLLSILFINIAELLVFHFTGNFESFSLDKVPQNLDTKTELITFWNKISPDDKLKIFRLVMLDSLIIGLFSYFSMFWMQFVIVEDKNPINAFLSSIKAVFKDIINSFLIFIFCISGFFTIFVLNSILGKNVVIQFLCLMLFVYFSVYYTMMVFLYFERYRKA